MDPMTIVGLIVGLLAIVLSTIMDGNSFGSLLGPSSLLLVLLGTLGISMAGFQLSDLKRAPGAMIKSVTGGVPDPGEVVDTLVEMAGLARRDGVLALEPKIADLDDPFLATGLQQVVDGVDASAVREVLDIELAALDERHQTMINFLKTLGGYAPTMGMIGTVIGLINMLADLSDPAQLGKGMSLALLTTLYGVIFANMVFLPMGAKLGRLHEAEMVTKEMALEGVLAVQAGASPRALVERLEGFLVPGDRQGADGRSGAPQAEAA